MTGKESIGSADERAVIPPR